MLSNNLKDTEHRYTSSHYIFPVAVVGLERTFIRVSEDVGVVELCAIVILPVSTCPIAFPFNVRLSTDDGDAG